MRRRSAREVGYFKMDPLAIALVLVQMRRDAHGRAVDADAHLGGWAPGQRRPRKWPTPKLTGSNVFLSPQPVTYWAP
jgi:hypothetical protein